MAIKRLFLCFLLAISLVLPRSAVASANSTSGIIQDLLFYYGQHQENAETDIICLLEKLRAVDPAAAEDWQLILQNWHQAYVQSEVPPAVLPDGLPNDNSLCIAVMGFALNYDGTMRDELLGRLQTALDSAEKYPNAYILCSGGGTAQGNPGATEADVMAKWLIEQGIDSSRVIVENRSYSTELNALYSLKILSEEYPEVDSVALISSDYHLRRCNVLFYAAFVLNDWESRYTIVGSAGFDAGHEGNEDPPNDAESLGAMVGLTIDKSFVPTLSVLDEITVQGDTDYQAESSLNLTVTARYDTGYTRDVTAGTIFAGFDPNLSGVQTVTAEYTENSITATASLNITIAEPPTETTVPPATTSPTPAETEAAPETTAPEQPSVFILLLPLSLAVCAAIILIHILRKDKKRRRKKKH